MASRGAEGPVGPSASPELNGVELWATKKKYIFMHQNIDRQIPPSHRLFNADNLLKIIEESGKVKTVFQGHYHKGYRSECGGVKYIALPATCENDDAIFIFDI